MQAIERKGANGPVLSALMRTGSGFRLDIKLFMGLACSRGLARMTLGYGLLQECRCTGLKFMPQASRIQVIFRCRNKEKHGKSRPELAV